MARPNALWRYRKSFTRYKPYFLLGILALLATNLFAALIPLLIMEAIDRLQALSGEAATATQPAAIRRFITSLVGEGSFNRLLMMMLVFAGVVFVARVISRVCLTYAGGKIEYDFRNRLFGHLLAMPPGFFTAHPVGEVMSRMANDVEALRMMMGGGIMLSFNTLFTYLTCVPLMILISPTLTLLTFLVYPVCIYGAGRLSTRVKKLYYNVQTVLGDISSVVQENIAGMAVIQAYAREADENRRMREECQRYYDTYTGLIRQRVLMMMLFIVLGGLSYLAVLSVGGWQVIDGGMTFGGFVAFIFYLERITWPTASMGWTISTVQQGTAAIERLDDVLSVTPHIASPAKPVPLPEPVSGQIEMKNLSFAYHNPYLKQPPKPEPEPVLQGINLSIRPGETIAVVGPVGAGKSTLLSLLPRLYDVPENAVFLDGVDITQVSLEALRKAIVFMPQQNFLFSTSIAHNIGFGKPEILLSEEDQLLSGHIVPVAQTAHIHEEVMAFSRRYQTMVGERGVMLSGGQRQRVSLARAILLEAPVLILDDPFSNVDAETEADIIAALMERQVFRHKTTLFATHRFSLARQADRVVLLDAGRIIATGPHHELLSTQPLYQKLNRLASLQQEFAAGQPLAGKETGHGN